ncbi:MAG TPA: alpha-ketoglutarate-dependent dioxygenase AlkB [Reyranellaceae bacterium]|nr:alpha-ketoglutarate-dependent dioxygenase AlkB [Reyranellaceae bacterium]
MVRIPSPEGGGLGRGRTPPGFVYRADLLTAEQERHLVDGIARLPLKPFEFHGYLGKRRIASFGWRYDYSGRALRPSEGMPAFLEPLRERAARFAGLAPAALEHALVTEYTPGAGIGWHRDKAEFGDVVAVSLLAPCRLRFRLRTAAGWDRRSLEVAPRSAYLLRGEARSRWEHSIPPVEMLRYSVTFRTLA